MDAISPYSSPLYVMAKAAGARCNLQCRYCYYLEKQKLYEGTALEMPNEVLEQFVRDYLNAQSTPVVNFTWHGGEPLLRPLSFYRRALQLQKVYAEGKTIENSLQTNGTLLTDEWCEFLAENRFLVGISIDGPKEVHDAYRRDRGEAPTWERVMRGIELLNKHGVDWNAMAVVNNRNVSDPVGFYRFFRDELKCQFLQFAPIVEQYPDGRVTEFSVDGESWGEFLCVLFDDWVKEDIGKVFVQLFDATLANWCGIMPGVCTLAETCGHAGILEWNGDLYSCDHFVAPEHRLGNIRQQSILEMMHSSQQQRFGQLKRDGLPRQCRDCEVLFACHGECPKNRISTTTAGEPGLNYLCAGYRRFFHHVRPTMDELSRQLSMSDSYIIN